MTEERPVSYSSKPASDRLDRPAFRLALVLAAHRDTILWLAAEADRWRWEAERLRGENEALRSRPIIGTEGLPHASRFSPLKG